jgi:hypothetical protein
MTPVIRIEPEQPTRRKHFATRYALSEADAAVQFRDGAGKVANSLEAHGAAD